MKIYFDFIIALILMIILTIPLIVIAIAIMITSEGPVIHWSKRVGKNNSIFLMPKFRTMHTDTPEVATHLLKDAHVHSTPIGLFLRSSSLDELPQLWSVLKGDMSIVGPRPALFNQDDLIALRTQKGVDQLIPGITGWAQVNGRDDIPIPVKVEYDEYYLKNQSFLLDMKILWKTIIKVVNKEGVSH